MALKQHLSPGRFPDALSGGERQDNDDHRVGETQRQGPKIDLVDPAQTQPRPDASEDKDKDKDDSSKPEGDQTA